VCKFIYPSGGRITSSHPWGDNSHPVLTPITPVLKLLTHITHTHPKAYCIAVLGQDGCRGRFENWPCTIGGLCSINSSVGVAVVSRRVTPLLIGVTLGVHEGVRVRGRESFGPARWPHRPLSGTQRERPCATGGELGGTSSHCHLLLHFKGVV
jgi:hypothetical protein